MKNLSIIVINALTLIGIFFGTIIAWPAMLVMLLYEKSESENPFTLGIAMCVAEIIYLLIVLYLGGCR